MQNFYTALGVEAARGHDIGIAGGDLLRHLYIIGKTGTGKTTLLENIVVSAIQSGQGVCFIDPHGDAVQRVAQYVPKMRTNDVVWFNPSDMAYPLAFNPLVDVAHDYRARVASGVVSAYQNGWGDSWGARLHDILFNAVYALIEDGNASLISIPRLLNRRDYRERVLRKVTNPDVLDYWRDEYAHYTERWRVEVTTSVLNKVRRFIIHPAIKNCIGQRRNKLDLRRIMDERKILLVDLSKGKLGEEATGLLGGLLINQLNHKALERADTVSDKRVPFFLVVDEFQNFGNQVFKEILSESRKYGLGLVLAHQYIEQINTDIKNAVLGNAGSLVSFRVGAGDADELHHDLDCNLDYLITLPRFKARIKMLAGGETQNAYTIDTYPLRFDPVGNLENIQKQSRRRYCVPRGVVEQKISRMSR